MFTFFNADTCSSDEYLNVRYKAHPNDCSKFCQCAPKTSSTYRWYAMPCAPGTLWNQYLVICDHESNVECVGPA